MIGGPRPAYSVHFAEQAAAAYLPQNYLTAWSVDKHNRIVWANTVIEDNQNTGQTVSGRDANV